MAKQFWPSRRWNPTPGSVCGTTTPVVATILEVAPAHAGCKVGGDIQKRCRNGYYPRRAASVVLVATGLGTNRGCRLPGAAPSGR